MCKTIKSPRIPHLVTIVLLFLWLLLSSCTRVHVHVSASAPPSTGEEVILEPSCDLKEKSLPNIVETKQQTGSWCWAASAQMAISAFNQEVKQCSIVDATYPGRNCCEDWENNGKIDNQLCLESGLADYGLAKYAFDYDVKKPSGNPDVLWNRLVDHICKDMPVVYEYNYIGGGGHTNVIHGFRDDSGVTGRWVELEDHFSEEADFEQVNFDYEIVFSKNDDPIRSGVWYTWNIQPE